MNNINLNNNVEIEALLPLMEDIFKEYSFLKINDISKLKIIQTIIIKTKDIFNNSTDYNKYLCMQLKKYLYDYTKKCLYIKEKSIYVINNYLLSLQPADSFESAKENLYNLKLFMNKYGLDLDTMVIENLISNSEAFNNVVKFFINESDIINNDDLIKLICTLYYKKINDDMLNMNYSDNLVASDESILNRIYRLPLLSDDEKRILFDEYKNGSIEARDRIIEAHMRLVVSIACKHRGHELPLEDLIQEGCLGLVEALKHYDASKNTKFDTCAYYWIKSYVFRAIKSKSRMVRLPESIYDKLLDFKRAKIKLESELSRDVSVEEMAEYMNISLKKAIDYYNYLREPISLSLEVGDDEYVEDRLKGDAPIPEDEVCIKDIKNIIKSLIGKCKLSEKQLYILYLKYGFSGRVYTFKEIAQMMNVSCQNINDSEKYALKKIRKVKGLEEHRIYLD